MLSHTNLALPQTHSAHILPPFCVMGALTWGIEEKVRQVSTNTPEELSPEPVCVVSSKFQGHSLDPDFLKWLTLSHCQSCPPLAVVLSNVFSRHGFPRDIVSDRGSQFVSQFWSSVRC